MKKKESEFLLKQITKIYDLISTPYTLVVTILVIIIWFIVGIPMQFNEIWYKALHLFELLVTLILVFIIEITQKAEMKAIQEKLDEMIMQHPKIDNKKAGIEKKYKGQND